MSHYNNDCVRYHTPRVASLRLIRTNVAYFITGIVLALASLTSILALFVVSRQVLLLTISTIASGVAYFTFVIGMMKGDS